MAAQGVILFAAAPELGTLPGWLTLVVVVSVAWILYRGGTGTAVSGLQDANRELERQIKEKAGQLSALERINAELRAEKDVNVAIVPVVDAMKSHEVRAQERHEKTLIVLDLIAERLGPDHNSTHEEES